MTDLALASVDEQGIHFETGVPVVFRFLRNTEKSPYMGARFGQDIEPAGRYMIHNEEPGEVARGWESGVVSFENPLVILLTLDDEVYGPLGWKARLRDAYGATGRELSSRLIADGYDGIVTVGEYAHRGRTTRDTREIVDLRPAMQKNGNDWAYHVTLEQFLPSIAKKGLLPKPHSSVPDDPVIFVERDEDGVSVYREPGAVTLRFAVDGFGCTEDGEDVLYDRIPPEDIFVRRGKRWVRLLEDTPRRRKNSDGHFLGSVESAIAWALENVGDAEQNYPTGDAAKEFNRENGRGAAAAQRQKMEEQVAEYVGEYGDVMRRGSARVWRAIRVPDDAAPTDVLNWDDLGTHWSFRENATGDYGYDGRYGDRPTRIVQVSGVVAAGDIDWEYGFTSFWYYGLEQFECAVVKGAVISDLTVDGRPVGRVAAANPRRQVRARLLGVPRCSVRGCGRDHYARGWCMRHYMHHRIRADHERADLTKPVRSCRARACRRNAVVNGLCRKHAVQVRVHGRLTPERELGIERPCRVRRCRSPHVARGLCMRHYDAWTRRNPLDDPRWSDA